MATRWVLAEKARRFRLREDGGITVFALFLTIVMFIIAGIAIDTSRLQTRTTMLQNTADSAAYAAARKRVFGSTAVATNAALRSAWANMPPQLYGNVITEADVEWGTWNTATRTFTLAPNGMAVRVTARQSVARGNPFTNILLGWVGVRIAEPARVAVATPQRNGGCPRGFLSQTKVDIQSNNSFYDGFCLYGDKVEVQSNGVWEAGTSVMAPSLSNITGGSNATGLDAAKTAGSMELPEITQIGGIINSLRTDASNSLWTPSYITNTTPNYINKNSLNNGDLQSGRIYITRNAAPCSIDIIGIIRNVVLISDCAINFKKTGGNDPAWQSSILATTSTAANSIDGPQGMILGEAGGCAQGRGSNWLTMGSVKLPSGFLVDGGQIMARGSVTFTALGNSGGSSSTTTPTSYKGLNVIAGGTISGTSLMTQSTCGGTPWNGAIRVPVVRLVL